MVFTFFFNIFGFSQILEKIPRKMMKIQGNGLGAENGVMDNRIRKKVIKIIVVIEKIKNPDLSLLEMYLNTI